jgi:glutaminyl-peptide cyclotransferase
MILLDMVGDRDLAIGREPLSRHALWKQARTTARRVGVASVFTDSTVVSVLDDHVPFLEQGVPALGPIDSDFGCWHRRCDDLRAVSPRSLDAVGETVYELLRSF